MWRSFPAAAAVAWAVAWGGIGLVPATAQEDSARDANREDVRCVIGMSVMSRNETYKSWGLTGVFYYVGRIEGRSPGYSLDEAIKREVRKIQPVEYNGLIRGCSDRLSERSRAFEAMKPPAPRGVGR